MNSRAITIWKSYYKRDHWVVSFRDNLAQLGDDVDQWCRDNLDYDPVKYLDYYRFKSRDDALLCYLAFR